MNFNPTMIESNQYCTYDLNPSGEQIINLINQGRSAGIHAILSTQSLSDLGPTGNAFTEQVLNNCNNYLIQRQNNHSDAERLAQVIGTRDSFELTSQISDDASSRTVGSVRRVKAFMVHPDEIKRLQVGEAVYVNKQTFNCQRVCLKVDGL